MLSFCFWWGSQILRNSVAILKGRIPPSDYPETQIPAKFFKPRVRFIIVLQMEDKPKDVMSDLRRESDTHWNLILPQI